MEDTNSRKELTLRECQQASLQVLVRFDAICKANGFRYYLMYGTLIGAVRHNGFIPWDDDLDVMMPRPDFDRFAAYFEAHEAQLRPLRLHTRANTKNYPHGIPRLSDMTYQYINLDAYEMQYDIGAFIDIYPWDNFGSSQQDADVLWTKCNGMNRAYAMYLFSRNKDDSPAKAAARRLAHLGMRILKGKDYDQRIDAEVRDYILSHTSDADRYLGLLVYALGVQFDKSKLMDLKAVPHEFEGYSFDIPAAYDYILRKSYGDYMTPPPEDQRNPAHFYKIVRR